MNKKKKRITAMLMAVILSLCAVMPPNGSMVFASDVNEVNTEELEVYDATVRTDLDADEVVVAEDIIVAVNYGFDIIESKDGLSFDDTKVDVSYYADKGSFDGTVVGEYDTYYKVTPLSGKEAYLVHRVISVREPETVSDNTASGDTTESEETEPEEGELAKGEIVETEEPLRIMMSSVSVLKASATADDSMKVSYSGYVSYCGRRMGVKYISTSGDYYKCLVFCMDLNKNTTSGSVEASSSKVKPEITYCLVNGARKLGGTCHNDKYSAGSANADYFITSAAIHVLNGEVGLSYYNDGSSVYKKIASLVEDAKKCDSSEYADNGLTKSITYNISPKKSEWKDMGDGLYRSADKFVRTKSGSITNVKYTITGAPSGLTVGEIKTDASEIENPDDLKKYDICVAQTDASKASSNFYLYCNAEALAKIQENGSTIKVKAKAYSNEKGGRKWTPTVVSQQKITFLETFEDVVSDQATVKVTSNFKLGSFSLKKTNTYNGQPVHGATYYLYEDAACTDLLCKLKATDANGLVASDVEILTEATYYLKEVKAPQGYKLDETIYPIGLEYFTLYDAEGKVIQQGKALPVKEEPEPVGVMVQKTDSKTGVFVKGAGFAVFNDAACTQRTTVDGITEVPIFYYDEDLQIAVSQKFEKKQDYYYVKEVVVPEGYRDDGTIWTVTPNYGEFAILKVNNTPIRCDVSATKEDKETGKKAQGDAKLEGALYGLYATSNIVYPDGSGVVTYSGDDNITSTKGTDFVSTGAKANAGALLATVKTDKDGNFNFGNLYYGNYHIKEIKESYGYQLDTTTYTVNFSEASNKHQNISLNRKVLEPVKKQAFEIIKISTDGSDAQTDYVKGAEFTVKLQSEIDKVGWDKATTYDVLVTDEKGYAVSKELPFGKYLVKETKVPKDLHKTEDFTVDITEDSRTPQAWRVLNDAPFKAYIRIVKKDAESGRTILLPNVTFKIKNTDTDQYVEQKVGDKKISEFTTDETGTVTTPLRMKYGNYEVEEITAPEGYLLSDETYPFVITKDGTVQIEEDADGEAVIEVVAENTPVKGSISVKKSGEVLTGMEYDTIVDRIMSELSDENRSVNFIYENQPLAGAVYHLIALEDIYTPDHQLGEDGERELAVINGVPTSKGSVVAELTTDENGEASITDLPLGKYQLVEVTAPEGFVLCEDAKEIALTYVDSSTEVVYSNSEFINERIKTDLSLVKTDSVTSNPVPGALYGVFAKEDILNVDGEVLVNADELVDYATTNEEGIADFVTDLPLGLYYVKEMESPSGYVLDESIYDVDFSSQGQLVATITTELQVKETPIVVEVSKSDITTGKEINGAILEIIDSEGNVYASWTTDGTLYQLHAMPAGEYTLKETFAPYGYLIANEVPFTVAETGEIQKVSMVDERVKGRIELHKSNDETGEPIKGVEFELRDENGKVLQKLVTDKLGYAETDLLDICTYKEDGSFDADIKYYIVETKAAKGYILDDTVHEVVIQYDGCATETVHYQLIVTNKPTEPKLPQTGGNYNPFLFGLAGGALIGIGWYFMKRRKKRK